LDGNDHDEVRKIWNRVRPFEELRAVDASAYNVSVVKEALCQLGICARETRPPSSSLPPAMRAKVTDLLEQWGLLS
jgi:4-hydroxy-tetrahydrodipicolinate synthase